MVPLGFAPFGFTQGERDFGCGLTSAKRLNKSTRPDHSFQSHEIHPKRSKTPPSPPRKDPSASSGRVGHPQVQVRKTCRPTAFPSSELPEWYALAVRESSTEIRREGVGHPPNLPLVLHQTENTWRNNLQND